MPLLIWTFAIIYITSWHGAGFILFSSLFFSLISLLNFLFLAFVVGTYASFC